jgi:hypothetical protein
LRLENTKEFFGGRLLPKFSMAVHGSQGEGKSEFAYLFMDDLAKNLAPSEEILFFASEENPEYGRVGARLRRMRIANPSYPVNRIKFIYSKDYADFIRLVETEKFKFAFVDSVNKLKNYAKGQMDVLSDTFPKTSFIFIFHSSQDKRNNKGDAEAVYDADTVVQVREGVAYIDKHRDSAETKPLQVFKHKEGLANRFTTKKPVTPFAF